MGFTVGELLSTRRGEGHALHAAYANPQVSRLLHSLDSDRVYERAEGAYLYDAQGRRYLDMLAGFGVFAVGRNHPVVAAALREVLDAELADLVQFDCSLLSGLLAEQLVARAPGMDRVYWCNSGSEAVEAAVKFARAATRRGRILYCGHGYHGLTAGALSANGNVEFRRGFGPLLPGAVVPFGDLAALRTQLVRGDVAALLIEPIQGKGVHLLPPGFLAAARDLLHEHGALLICDEVQTGIGRTGTFFAYEHEQVEPDIVTAAKALSGGFLPVGATLAKSWIFDKVYSSIDRVFVHASTFAGNALAMAAGLATLAVLDDEQLVARAETTGAALQTKLRALADRYELLAEVRGRGLMIGLEFGRPSSPALRATWSALRTVRKGLVAQMMVGPLFQQHRVLTQVAGDHMEVIKLLPSLTIGAEESDWFVGALDSVLADAHRGGRLARDFGHFAFRQVRHATGQLTDS